MFTLGSCYEEDCERLPVLQQLRILNLFVVGSVSFHSLSSTCTQIDYGQINVGKVAKNRPSESRIAAWHKQTGSHFDPFDAMAELTHKQMECPRCRTRVFVRESSGYSTLWRLMHLTAFINDNGTGYSEKKFSALCPLPGCRLKITKGNLAVAKFARDLTEDGNEDYMALSGTQVHAIFIADEIPAEVCFLATESGILDGRRQSKIS